jgi:Family of unknown function (DUF6519)/Right handed beta helix region
MSSDISRQRFDAKNDFSGVLMQQGRVLLDADWNEWLEIIDRRRRAETVDTIGRAVVPLETPNGFKIVWDTQNHSLLIGPGRIYVHGLLAENHGAAPLDQFDPILCELRSGQWLKYADQFPHGGTKPLNLKDRTLVYLDVWQREVTVLEDPGLLESAVGVDTTCRLQTAWQVRVLENVAASVNCTDPFPAWDQLTAPSAGRLSTDTIVPADNPDPCVLPPTGGYRGLENRLYRVEIHDDGSHPEAVPKVGKKLNVAIAAAKEPIKKIAGKATFKWARHNASIATAVRNITGAKLTVDLTQRDRELRFSIGDWVEIIDDVREYAGLPGVMRRVVDVDDAAAVLTLEGALPTPEFPNGAVAPARHLRVRKWDQKGKVLGGDGQEVFDLNGSTSTGAIPIMAEGDSFLLEDGIRITFHRNPGTGKFHVADSWVFAARTADASIELLEKSPPRGIHHHYCGLAIVTPNSATDCRIMWPPRFGGGDTRVEECCDCTVCVTAELHNSGTLTIQQAVVKAMQTGGTVCLGPGIFYLLGNERNVPAISVTGAKAVKIKGHGSATVLVHAGQGVTVLVKDALGCTLEDFAIFALGGYVGVPVIALQNCVEITVQRCFVIQTPVTQTNPGDVSSGLATILSAGASTPTSAPRVAIGLGGFIIFGKVRENIILAGFGIANSPVAKVVNGQVTTFDPAPLFTASVACEDNTLVCRVAGIVLEKASIHFGESRFTGNSIGAAQTGIRVTGFVPGGALASSSNLDIADNFINSAGYGIAFGTNSTRVANNDLGPSSPGDGHAGILIEAGALPTLPVDDAQITGNRIRGLLGHGVEIATNLGAVEVSRNTIEAMGGGGIVMTPDKSGAEQLNIEQNRLMNFWNGAETSAATDNAPVVKYVGSQATVANAFPAAIDVYSAKAVTIAGNVLDSLGTAPALAANLRGISVINSDAVRIAANQVTNIGSPTVGASETTGILVGGKFRQLDVVDNHIRRSTGDAQREVRDRLRWQALRIIQPTLPPLPPPKGSGKTEPDPGELKKILALPSASSTGIRGNSMICHGVAPLIQVETGGDCLCGDNRVDGLTAGTDATVQITTRSVILNANYVTGSTGDRQESVALEPATWQFTALANITSGRITVHSAPLPTPWSVLNSHA